MGIQTATPAAGCQHAAGNHYCGDDEVSAKRPGRDCLLIRLSMRPECARGMAFGDHGISGSVSLYTRQGGLACGGVGKRKKRRKEGAEPARYSPKPPPPPATRKPRGREKPAAAETGPEDCRG